MLTNLGHCNKWDLFGWPSSVHLPNLYQGKFIFYQRSEQKYWLLVLIFWTNLDDFFLKCKTLCGNLKKRSKILSIYLTLFLASKLSAIVFSEMQMTFESDLGNFVYNDVFFLCNFQNTKNKTAVKLTAVSCAPVVEVKIKRPDTKYQLGFSVQNGVVSWYFLICKQFLRDLNSYILTS